MHIIFIRRNMKAEKRTAHKSRKSNKFHSPTLLKNGIMGENENVSIVTIHKRGNNGIDILGILSCLEKGKTSMGRDANISCSKGELL